jgi:carboxymethylenebutenolidase
MKKKMSSAFGDYGKGQLPRRRFLTRLAILTGSITSALSLFPVIKGKALLNIPLSDQTEPIRESMVEYPCVTGKMKAFLALPDNESKFPAVIVIHENRGLVPHIKEVTRRMAKEGFLSLAPDALSPVGGTPDDISNVGELFAKLDSNETTQNFVSAVAYLKTHPNSSGKVGCTGFCWGGAMTNQVAVKSEDLDAAVPYYGRQPEPDDVKKIKAPVLAHYAENDERINAGIAAFEEALKAAGKEYHIFIYPGTGHGFNNDTNPGRYPPEAAKLAWDRTIDFFRDKLE